MTDLEDVRALADTLVLMDQGRVVTTGPTADVLEAPPSADAAALVGAALRST